MNIIYILVLCIVYKKKKATFSDSARDLPIDDCSFKEFLWKSSALQSGGGGSYQPFIVCGRHFEFGKRPRGLWDDIGNEKPRYNATL